MVADKELQTFAAFEGRVDGHSIKGVSLLQMGPALGHGVWVDRTMLEQCKKLATGKAKLKAKQNHWSGIEDTIGFYENFRIRSGKLVADLTLFESSPSSALMLEMIETIPESFGVSIMFAPDEAEYDKDNDRYNARVRELYSADLVDTPAANRTGVFHAAVDSDSEDMATEAKSTEPKAESFDAKAEIEALKAIIEKLSAPKSEPEPPKPDDAIAGLQSKIQELADTNAALLKAFAAAPTPSTPPAPPNEREEVQPPQSYAAARKEAIGTATGLARLKALREFEAIHPNEAAYLKSFQK